MYSPELLIISALKAVVEIAALSLVAQGILGMLAGATRQQNFFYRLFQILTTPFTHVVRLITPQGMTEGTRARLTFLMLVGVWIALIYAKAAVCHAHQLACFAH
ncbi:MAG: hypothetical protein HOP24_01045 [Sideroxydans sp.]|nr:hypothetical protein [Sideroxydans sp.]